MDPTEAPPCSNQLCGFTEAPPRRRWIVAGGFVTADVAGATEEFVTTIVVGKDAISRTSAVSFERLQDQMVVALARCKLSKLR
jgi:hypothetical protein